MGDRNIFQVYWISGRNYLTVLSLFYPSIVTISRFCRNTFFTSSLHVIIEAKGTCFHSEITQQTEQCWQCVWCRLMCTLYSCTVHLYTVSGLALPVTLLCSARHHPGPGGTPGQCHWYNSVWQCSTSHWSGPVCFKAADRIWVGSCPEIEERDAGHWGR